MKNCIVKFSLLAIVFALAVGTVDAQTTTPRKSKKRSTKKSNTSKNASSVKAVAPAKDTTKPAAVVEADIKLDTPRS